MIERRTLTSLITDIAGIVQIVSIISAMFAIVLGFLLPFSYLSHRSALWLMPKIASSQYASLFVIAFMMVMLLMAAPAIASFVLAPLRKDVVLPYPKVTGILMAGLGAVCAYASQRWLFSWCGLAAAAGATACFGVGIDICFGFWKPGAREQAEAAGDNGICSQTDTRHGKRHKSVWIGGFCNWVIRALGGFLALGMLWFEAAAAVSRQPLGPHENCKIALFLIAMAVLLTTLGNALGVWVTQQHRGSYEILLVAVGCAFLIIFWAGQMAPVALFAMRISGMGGIYESIYLRPGINEGHILPGFHVKPQHGSLKVCVVAQPGSAFYISVSKACAEQIKSPGFYRIWRLPRADVAWLSERKPSTNAQSHGADKSNATKGKPQHAPGLCP